MPMREGRQFQWWRLRWYWPEREKAGKAYRMRLLYTGRTVMRMLDNIESLDRIISRQQDEISKLADERCRGSGRCGEPACTCPVVWPDEQEDADEPSP